MMFVYFLIYATRCQRTRRRRDEQEEQDIEKGREEKNEPKNHGVHPVNRVYLSASFCSLKCQTALQFKAIVHKPHTPVDPQKKRVGQFTTKKKKVRQISVSFIS